MEPQVQAYAPKRERKEDLMDFIIARSCKEVCKLIETTWK